MKKLFLLIPACLFLLNTISAQTVSDIRKVKFENFTFKIRNKTVKMKDGLQVDACPKDEDGMPSGDIWNVLPENIAYGDLNGDGKVEAIIPMIANVCGGNMLTDETVLVYTLKNGKPSKLPEFEYFDEGCQQGEKNCNFTRNPGVLVSYDAKLKALVVETFFATEDDSTCCPSLSRKTWYKWNGAEFTELKKSKIVAAK